MDTDYRRTVTRQNIINEYYLQDKNYLWKICVIFYNLLTEIGNIKIPSTMYAYIIYTSIKNSTF